MHGVDLRGPRYVRYRKRQAPVVVMVLYVTLLWVDGLS